MPSATRSPPLDTAGLDERLDDHDKLTPLEYLEFVAGLWGIDPAVSEPTLRSMNC